MDSYLGGTNAPQSTDQIFGKLNDCLGNQCQSAVKCGICCSTLREAWLPSCNHPFCRECINQCFKLRTRIECPICRQIIAKRACVPSPYIDQLVKLYLQVANRFKSEIHAKVTVKLPDERRFLESQASSQMITPLKDFKVPTFAVPAQRKRKSEEQEEPLVKRPKISMSVEMRRLAMIKKQKEKRALDVVVEEKEDDEGQKVLAEKRAKLDERKTGSPPTAASPRVVSPTVSTASQTFPRLPLKLPKFPPFPLKQKISIGTNTETTEEKKFAGKKVQVDFQCTARDVRRWVGHEEEVNGMEKEPLANLFECLPWLKDKLAWNWRELLELIPESERTIEDSEPPTPEPSERGEPSPKKDPPPVKPLPATISARRIYRRGLAESDTEDIDEGSCFRHLPFPPDYSPPVWFAKQHQQWKEQRAQEKKEREQKKKLRKERKRQKWKERKEQEQPAKNREAEATEDCVPPTPSKSEELVLSKSESDDDKKENLKEEVADEEDFDQAKAIRQPNDGNRAQVLRAEEIKEEPPSPEKRSSNAHDRILKVSERIKMTISVSRVNTFEDKRVLQKFGELFPDITLTEEVEEGCTHLVMMNTDNNGISKNRSLRYVFAIARKCHIVTKQWMEACIRRKHIVAWDRYGVWNDQDGERATPWIKAREASVPLLEGKKFYVPCDFCDSKLVPRAKVIELIKLCGGEVVDKIWEMHEDGFILFAHGSKDTGDARRFELDTKAPVVSVDLLLDNIAEYITTPWKVAGYRICKSRRSGGAVASSA